MGTKASSMNLVRIMVRCLMLAHVQISDATHMTSYALVQFSEFIK